MNTKTVKPILLLCLFIGIACVACKKQRDCHLPGFIYKFIGFDSMEKRLIIVRCYESGSNRTKLLAERLASSSEVPRTMNDTLAVDELYFGNQGDEVITLPYAGGRTFIVRDLSTGDESKSFGLLEEVDIDCTQSWNIYVNDTLLSSRGTPATGSNYQNKLTYDITLKK